MYFLGSSLIVRLKFFFCLFSCSLRRRSSKYGLYDPKTATFVKISLKNRPRILLIHLAIIPRRPVTYKRREFMLELKRRSRTRVQTEMVEFISLPFPSSKKLILWSFRVLVVKGWQRNVKKSVIMHVQSCCIAN